MYFPRHHRGASYCNVPVLSAASAIGAVLTLPQSSLKVAGEAVQGRGKSGLQKHSPERPGLSTGSTLITSLHFSAVKNDAALLHPRPASIVGAHAYRLPQPDERILDFPTCDYRKIIAISSCLVNISEGVTQ